MASTPEPESAEDYFERVLAEAGADRRLPVAVEEMPGWFIYPYEVTSLRIKPLEPLAEAEEDREGEDPASCWCAADSMPEWANHWVWRNDDWLLTLAGSTGAPIQMSLMPRRVHADLPTMPAELSMEMGQLLTLITAVAEDLPSVGRVFVMKIGDGSAHLHWFFFGRPARALQLRGSPFLDWEENLPRVPLDVLQTNGAFVAERLVAALGGEGPSWA